MFVQGGDELMTSSSLRIHMIYKHVTPVALLAMGQLDYSSPAGKATMQDMGKIGTNQIITKFNKAWKCV